jgi:diacylglycerol kinase family enzyme
MAVRVTLIINPFASSVTHRARVIIQQMLSADHDLSVRETTKGGHAIRLAHGAARAGAEVIIALGGDGTINEVANGILGDSVLENRVLENRVLEDRVLEDRVLEDRVLEDRVLEDDPEGAGLETGGGGGGPAIVPLPGGSTNVFARSLGYPNDPIEATAVLVSALAASATIEASVGVANGRAFLFHAGAGFDAAVVEKVEQRGPLKRYAGHPLFVATTLSTWFRRIDRKNPWFSVTTDDGRSVLDGQLAIALNCNPYTFLGSRPLDLAPEANLSSPLSIVALRSLSAVRLAPAALQAIRSVNGVPDKGSTVHWPDVQGATIRGYRPFPYQLDGEFLAPVTTLRLENRASAVRLVIPPDRYDDHTASGG